MARKTGNGKVSTTVRRLLALERKMADLERTTADGFKALMEVSEIQTNRLVMVLDGLRADVRLALTQRPKIEELDRRLTTLEALAVRRTD